MQKKELIIFDMDGTLIDSGDVITNTINFVRGHLGLDIIEKKTMLEQLNNPDINSSEYFYGTKEFTDQQTVLFTQYYDENCIKEIKLYDGIAELLKDLKKDFRLSIATNASKDFAVRMCKHLGIINNFDLIVGATCVEKPKPHSDMILKTLNNLNVEKDYSILVGDSHKDSRAAQNAEIDSILVNWGFTHHLDETVAKNTDELYGRLSKLK